MDELSDPGVSGVQVLWPLCPPIHHQYRQPADAAVRLWHKFCNWGILCQLHLPQCNHRYTNSQLSSQIVRRWTVTRSHKPPTHPSAFLTQTTKEAANKTVDEAFPFFSSRQTAVRPSHLLRGLSVHPTTLKTTPQTETVSLRSLWRLTGRSC